MEHISKFKYLGFAREESSADEAEYCKKVVDGRRVAVAIRSLVNAEYARVWHKTLIKPFLMYGSETMQ